MGQDAKCSAGMGEQMGNVRCHHLVIVLVVTGLIFTDAAFSVGASEAMSGGTPSEPCPGLTNYQSNLIAVASEYEPMFVDAGLQYRSDLLAMTSEQLAKAGKLLADFVAAIENISPPSWAADWQTAYTRQWSLIAAAATAAGTGTSSLVVELLVRQDLLNAAKRDTEAGAKHALAACPQFADALKIVSPSSSPTTPVPSPIATSAVPAGRNSLANVVEAFRHVGIQQVTVEPHTVQSPVLTPPGQRLDVDGAVIYVFVYTDGTAAREKESANLSPESILLPSAGSGSGTPVVLPSVFAFSNVIVVLVGGSEELAHEVQRAVESLP